MAIKNASDLLVYRKYPNGQKQVTRIKVKISSPMASAGDVRVKNIAKKDTGSGTVFEDKNTGTASANTGTAVLTVIKDLLQGSLYGYTFTDEVTEGDFVYRDFTNFDEVACPNPLEVVQESGSPAINEGAILVNVEVEGVSAPEELPVAFSTSASLSISRDLRDTTNKDSGGFQQSAPGLMSFELSTDALQDYTSDLDFKDFFDNVGNREEIVVQFSERRTGGTDIHYQGNAYVSSLSMDAGVEDNVTYSVTFTGTGLIAYGTD
jgi:predicted secreted protein